MALRLRPNRKTLATCPSLRLSPSFSTSSPPPPPSGDGGDGGDKPKDDSAPNSHASLFSEIKSRLRQRPPSTPRRIPLSPPEPPPLGPQKAAPSAAATLEEIRRNLSEFSRKPKSPFPTSSADIYKSKVIGGESGDAAASGAPDRPLLESMIESLRNLGAGEMPSGHRPRGRSQGGSGHPLDLKFLADSLARQPGEPASAGGGELLSDSIFGRELLEKRKREEGGKEGAPRVTEFMKAYDYDELGEKLRRLRPAEVEACKKKGWFSLEELNERLAKLREQEMKNEKGYSIGGVSFWDLRDSLVKLKDVDQNKKASMNTFSILANLGGQTTPMYMLKPPKEELVKKYSLSDHLSAAEKLKLELKKVRDEFKMSESDCGSTRVQVAQLTKRIRYLEPILYTKKKGKGLKGPDKHSIKGLVAMVKKRNKLLKYLRRTDWESYCMVLSKLDIRDIEKKEVKVKKGSKDKLRGKKGKGKYSKTANYA